MDAIRNGNFNSSEIVALTSLAKDGKSFGAPAMTFITECNMERNLGRSIEDEVNARPLTYGKVLEQMVHDKLPIDYYYCSDETKVHPKYDFWVGSKDGGKNDTGKTVTDIKNPMTLKSFCQLVDPLYDGLTGMDAMNAIREGYTDPRGLKHAKHKDGEKFYWQLVSNACIEGAEHCELIVHMPYESQLETVSQLAQGNDNAMWIAFAKPGDLPFLLDGGKYKDVNIIRFTPSVEDRTFLEDCTKRASKMLIERTEIKTTT